MKILTTRLRPALIFSGLVKVFIATQNMSAAQSSAVAARPDITITRDGGQAKIVFTATLQSADAVTGPWSDVPAAVSPYFPDTATNGKFYRTRWVPGIFFSQAVVPLTITAPLQEHFELAHAGTPDGIFPPLRQKPYFDGEIQMEEFALPVTLRVRGNSSLQECPFPKLKFKVSKKDRIGTPFADAREIKIGTHCAEGGRGNIGRLRDQTAAFREALAYETMCSLGFAGPRVRRARIDYHDTTATNVASETGWKLTRHALILDDVDVVAERLEGRALSDEEIAALTNANFDEQLILDLQFLHVLLGNWDYALSTNGQGLRNTDVIALADGKLLPVAGDFDLSSWVTEIVRGAAPQNYHPELGDVERQARYELEQLQKRVDETRFAAASNRFLMQQAAIQLQISQAEIDDNGRANALRHVAAFFDALAAVAR